MRSRVTARRLLTLAAAAVCVWLPGCVALHRSTAEFVEVRVPYVTKSEVLSLFGEPKRTSTDAGIETWHYKFLAYGLSDKAVVETVAGGTLLMPGGNYTTTRYDENVRISFSNEAVIGAQELVETASGFSCGFFLTHGIGPTCGRYAPNADAPAVRVAGPRPVTEYTGTNAVSFGPYCGPPPLRWANAAACFAYQAIGDDWPKGARFDAKVQDLGTSYLVTFTRPGYPEQGSRLFRVMVATGEVIAAPATQP